MSSSTKQPKTQGFKVCTLNKQKETENRLDSIVFPRFNYRLSNFNTLQRFYLPQQQNNNSQLQGTSQQSGANQATLAHSKNKQLKKSNKAISSFTNWYLNENLKRGQLNINCKERQAFVEKNYNFNCKNELKYKQNTQNTKFYDKRQKIQEQVDKQKIQQFHNTINQQSKHMNSQNANKRSNPFQTHSSSQNEKSFASEPRSKRKNTFSNKKQGINSRYHSPQDLNHQENKLIRQYEDWMNLEINESFQGINIEIFTKNWLLQNQKDQQKQTFPLFQIYKDASVYKQVKKSQGFDQIKKKKPKEEENRGDIYQNESNVMMCPNNSILDDNRLPSYQGIFEYPGNESNYDKQDEQQYYQLNQFLLN